MTKFIVEIGSNAEVVLRWEEDEVLVGKERIVLGLGKKRDATPYTLRKAFSKLAKKLQEQKKESCSIEISSDMAAFGAEGILLGSYEFNKYKSEKKSKEIKEIKFIVKNAKELLVAKKDLDESLIFMGAVNYCRDLVNEPSMVTTPTYLASEALKISKEGNIKVKVYSKDEIAKMGMEAFLGVSKGSDEVPKLIRMEYAPIGAKKHVLIAGKAITFDTGGLSLKFDEHMQSMKMDMAGGAAILSIFKVLEVLKLKIKVTGLIAACENMPSGKAIKPGDIVKAYNGKTIEVVSTDAEGRMTLADVLSYGVTLKPDIMIDLATLTGACMVALGQDIAGLFSTDKSLAEKLMKISIDVGEKLWEMPLDPDYKKLIDSPVADLSNVGEDRYGGAITAALFLKEFAGDVPWAHLDIAGPAFWEKTGPYGSKGGSGFGVRLILKYLMEEK